ncbi:hypothetical protein [Streptomyces sp. B93]|uniref:hypothetical protein n=1 Tax=Streptomyces sp. B93 TaxID=2824875 RepID=UPI001B3591FF|nr:hypothetical protein [Streptomyces sp. B93]MBQ1094256.1 hypothetical protein [Streptomyces sp. B93]
MNAGRPGLVTAHDQFEVDVRLRTGEDIALVIQDVQFQIHQHQHFAQLLARKNPIVRHFSAVQKNGLVELMYSPGLASNAAHAVEEFGRSLFHGLLLGATAKEARVRVTASQTPIRRAGQLTTGYSYHSTEQLKHLFSATGNATRAAQHAGHAWEDTQRTLDNLFAWAMGLPSKGYFIVEGGKPRPLPEIEDDIRFNDLRPVRTTG